jgi:glutamine synthetase adenylyltransferase
VQGDTLSKNEATPLKESYDFLRRCESILRRYENTSVSALPADPAEQTKVALRLGFPNAAAFTAKYEAARSTIHGIYMQRMKGPDLQL